MSPKTYTITGLIFLLIFTLVFPPSLVLGHDEGIPGGGPPGPAPDGPDGPPCGGCCGGCCRPDDCGCPGPGGSGGPGGGWGIAAGTGSGFATGGDPVFMRNGEFTLHATDVSIRGRSLSVDITRAYGSRREYNSRFGYGWDINYNLKVRRLAPIDNEPNKIVLLDGKGCRFEYTQDGNDPNIYVRSIDLGDYFAYDDANDTFTLVSKNSVEYRFDTDDKLSSIRDENGNSITFAYEQDAGYDVLLPVYGPSEFFLGEEFGGPPGGRGLIAMAYKLVKIADDLGREIGLSYNEDGLLSDVNDFTGRTWDYYYDPCTNDLLGVTGPTGLTTTYYYDDPAYNSDPNNNHNLTSITDPNDQTKVVNYYDYEDRVWKQTVGDGSYEFDYDPNNNTATITDREGFVTEMVYTDTGQLASETIYTADSQAEPNSFTTTYIYDENMQRTRIVLPAGNCIDYTYDDLGNITGEYRKIGPNEPNNPNDPNVIAVIYTYDPDFDYKVETIRDPEGNITTYDHNDLTGNLEKITYPTVTTPDGNEAPIASFTYNSFGQVETVTAPDGIVTKYEYYDDSDPNDPNCGQLWKVIVDYNETDGLNLTTEYTYDVLGNVITITDPNGNTTTSEYNALDQLTMTIAPWPFEYVTKFSYDENGNQSQIEREISGPNQVTIFDYDVRNKIESITDPLGNVTAYGYNKNEEPNIITDAENNSTVSEYNERGLLTKVTDANGGVTEYSYALNGKLAEIKDPNGNTTVYTYDGFDRLIKITYPGDTNEVFSYDKTGNIMSKKNRKGQIIYYEYDALNRQIVKNRPGDPDITYLYDIAGRVVDVNDGRSVSAGGGLTEHKYDRMGRVKEVNDIEGRLVSYEYDDRGLRTKLVYPDDSWITYEYDSMGHLRKIKDDSNPANVLAEYDYDELSRRMLVTLGNDANAVYEYDLANRLTKLTNDFNDISDINSLTFDYTYDKVGNRLTMTVDSNEHRYIYDVLYQLTEANYPGIDITSYSYDAVGNRVTVVVNGVTVSYDSNSLNQYISVDGIDYDYDLNGNLTDINDGEYEYIYDCENRLVEAKENSSTVATYEYDYLGRRASKTVSGTTTKYCYDGDQVIAEYDGSGTLLRKFIYGPGIDEPICIIDVSRNKTYYYHFDGLGSVAALSDANAAIVESYSYDVFGKPNRVSDVNNPYLFTGRRYDDETGLYYYRARYYSPEIGRFLQPDPIGVFLPLISTNWPARVNISAYLVAHGYSIEKFRQNIHISYAEWLNLYRYVGNNPILNRDPLGLKVPGYSGDCFKDCDTIFNEMYPNGCLKNCFEKGSGAVNMCQIGAAHSKTFCYHCCAKASSPACEDKCILAYLAAKNSAYAACSAGLPNKSFILFVVLLSLLVLYGLVCIFKVVRRRNVLL